MISCPRFSSGEEFETDFVFTCVGNKTRMDLASAAGLDLNEWGQVRVDRTDLHVIGKNTSKIITYLLLFVSVTFSKLEFIVILEARSSPQGRRARTPLGTAATTIRRRWLRTRSTTAPSSPTTSTWLWAAGKSLTNHSECMNHIITCPPLE